jgi:hypothetical protein
VRLNVTNWTVTNLTREPTAYPGSRSLIGCERRPALSPAGILENRVNESTRFRRIGKKICRVDPRREQQYSLIGDRFGRIEPQFK